MTEIIPKECRWQAMAIGTIVGFCGVGFIDFVHAFITFNTTDYESFGFLIMLSIYYVIIGLPLAFIACFALGVPIYLIINKLTPINLKAAITMGALMGLMFGFMNVFLFMRDWQLWLLGLDLMSTIVVGAFAGYISFYLSKQKSFNEEEPN